jgi:hypothetical protein
MNEKNPFLGVVALCACLQTSLQTSPMLSVRYRSGGSMKLNTCILHLAYMVYL